MGRAFRRHTFWLRLVTGVPIGAVPLLVIVWGVAGGGPFRPGAFPVVTTVFIPVWCIGAVFLTFMLFRSGIRRRIRAELIDKGVALCIHCGYNLAGQVESRCPECGEDFDPSLFKHGKPDEVEGDAKSAENPAQ